MTRVGEVVLDDVCVGGSDKGLVGAQMFGEGAAAAAVEF